MSYDIIICTRNRLSVLEISLPLFISQTKRASSIIIIDSSDNHNQVKSFCDSLFSNINLNINFVIYKSSPGTAFQRNAGLNFSKSEIIFFPDDDSLWYPDYAENILKIYGSDDSQSIGGIQGTAVKLPPPNAFLTKTVTHSLNLKDRISMYLGPIKFIFRHNFLEDPIFIEGFTKQKQFQIPDWIKSEHAIPCGPMTGFAMSFRAETIKRYKFDEILGTYSLFEDRDASLSVMGGKLVLTSLKANVFHYRSPESRTNGREWGMMHILNRAYVVCKHSTPSSKSRKTIKKYLLFKIFRYLLQATSRYGIQRLLGAINAFFYVDKLLQSTIDELPTVYASCKSNCIKK